MAARTLTYTVQMSAPEKGLHAGLNVLPFDLNSGATKFGTLSDMYLIGKVPNGAMIIDAAIRFGAQGSAAAHFALVALTTESGGAFSTNTTILASMTASTAATTFQLIAPVKISFSSDKAVQYAILALNCTTGASETVSFSIQGNIKFLTDGSQLA